MAKVQFDPDPAVARKTILEFLHRPSYRPISTRELLRQLHVPREIAAKARALVKDLLREKHIARVSGNLLAPVEANNVRGRITIHPSGFGIVKPDRGGPDVYVSHRALRGAADGNQVSLRITRSGARGRTEGTVVDILDRKGRRVLGILREERGGAVVEPFDPALTTVVAVPKEALGHARPGDAVEVEVLRRTRIPDRVEGGVVEVLGRPGEPGVDLRVVVKTYGLATEFPQEVLAEARRLPDAVPHSEAEARERFDDPIPVTIDGETARDFDDSISVAEQPGGAFRLFVHIADVAYFVAEGGILDAEARARGTSVYFPDRVLPMFPEKLSNDLCSLRAGEDRLVQSVILDLDADAKVRAVRFADGVIRSAARLTYTQVAEVFAGRPGDLPGKVVAMLLVAEKLARKLRARREARGGIDFDLPEPKIVFDPEGVMTGITVEPRNQAHELIEEFMLAANEAVAAHLESGAAPCLYRVHERPDPLKLEALASFAAHLSIPFRYDPAGIRPRDIQALLGKAEGRPEHPILSQVVLRSMKQARYSAENVGHFGLAAPVYCHFTSPIRRYPDLVVHRLLRAVRSGRRVDAPEDLSELADSCSRLERAAEQAEREVLLWRKIAFMKGREGDTFEGIVTGVTRYGLFIQLTESLVEGLLHVQQLGEEYFTFDEKRLELRGERAGKRYRLGDRLEVVVARVDTVLRRIDLTLVGGELQERRRGPRTARAARPGARRAGASEAAGAGPARGRRKTTSRTGRKHGNAKQGRKR